MNERKMSEGESMNESEGVLLTLGKIREIYRRNHLRVEKVRKRNKKSL